MLSVRTTSRLVPDSSVRMCINTLSKTAAQKEIITGFLMLTSTPDDSLFQICLELSSSGDVYLHYLSFPLPQLSYTRHYCLAKQLQVVFGAPTQVLHKQTTFFKNSEVKLLLKVSQDVDEKCIDVTMAYGIN